MAAPHFSRDPSPVHALIAALGVGVMAWELCAYGWDRGRASPEHATVVPMGRPLFAFGSAFVVIQLLLPLRHVVIPGDTNWTEQGHRWSWHMLLRSKSLEKMTVIVDPPGDAPPFEVDPKKHLLKHQRRKVAASPEMILIFARHLVEALDVPGAAVYVDVTVSLNGRPAARMIDPKQDLTKVSVPWLGPAPWMLPMPDGPATHGVVAEREED